MNVFDTSLRMLSEYPLCNHCLGRQFALLGYGTENYKRGKAIKLVLTLEAHASTLLKSKRGIKVLQILATNGFSKMAEAILRKMKKNRIV